MLLGEHTLTILHLLILTHRRLGSVGRRTPRTANRRLMGIRGRVPFVSTLVWPNAQRSIIPSP
jgi:hypothetical protein